MRAPVPRGVVVKGVGRDSPSTPARRRRAVGALRAAVLFPRWLGGCRSHCLSACASYLSGQFTAVPPAPRACSLTAGTSSSLSPSALAWPPWMHMTEASSGRQKQSGRAPPAHPDVSGCQPRAISPSLSQWLHLGHGPPSQLDEGDT